MFKKCPFPTEVLVSRRFVNQAINQSAYPIPADMHQEWNHGARGRKDYREYFTRVRIGEYDGEMKHKKAKIAKVLHPFLFEYNQLTSPTSTE